ncbi:unnamed protein product [Rhizophagus irregularis]|nr:unnamed protein product [Rhizophagus irregularis]
MPSWFLYIINENSHNFVFFQSIIISAVPTIPLTVPITVFCGIVDDVDVEGVDFEGVGIEGRSIIKMVDLVGIGGGGIFKVVDVIGI